VGIGTATPAYPLSVAGRISYSSGIGEGADLTVSSSSTTLQFGLGSSWVAQSFYLSGTTAMTLNSTGLNIANGNVILGTSGKGIDFSAVTGGTGTATGNVLNDYEEGTFTPTFTASSGTPTTVTLVSAAYTKIGRRVSIDVDFIITAIGTASGTLFLTLPFSQSTASTPCGAFVEVSVVGYTGAIFQIDATRSGLNFYNNATTRVNGYRYRGTYTYNV
jgi:hypothetical protein